MTTDLQPLIQHLRGGDWNLRSPQEMADMIADKLEAALAASPSSPSAPAEPAAQGGEPKIPAGWVPLRVEWEPGYPEDVAFGPQRMMDRLKKWLDCYFAMRLSESATPAPASPCASPAAAAVADAPRIPDADTYCERHTLAASDEWKRGWNYARVIQAKFGHTPDPQDVEPAAPPPSPSAAEQADDTLRWRLSTIAAECDDPDTTDALDKLLEDLPRGPGDGPVYAAAPGASPAEAPAEKLDHLQKWTKVINEAWPVDPQPVAPAGQAAAAPAVERGVAEERAAFEKWMLEDDGEPLWIAKCNDGSRVYADIETENMWLAWKARAALSTAGKEQA